MTKPSASPPPEVWGGVECSIVRIGDDYVDQLELSGHTTRTADLELFAKLGIRALRHPVLWERTAPETPERFDWRWADSSLESLRRMGVRPIVGLLHHGSGPRYTSLVDPAFPEKLAAYAGEVARRYPWVTDYTPVNEPLTTARFSTLYGHWYPHERDERLFVRALTNQTRGVTLAMQAIRRVNPKARLIQTEDLGKAFSTDAVAHQANFENHRRWLTWDLLCGRLDSGHPLWGWLRGAGAAEDDLEFHLEQPTPPDLIGINHYVTSNRFLDHRLALYPEPTHGGNGRERYADVAAVRVRHADPASPESLLREAWERYRIPMAITEAHIGCTREEQLRWFHDIWNAACKSRKTGVDVHAVTAWALLGAFDWDSLLTARRGRYEVGVFDVRAPEPRATALAHLLEQIEDGPAPLHPAMHQPGWWARAERFILRDEAISVRVNGKGRLAKSNGRPAEAASKNVLAASGSERRADSEAGVLLITGANGTLGAAFARICTLRGIDHQRFSRHDLDIVDGQSVDRVLNDLRPWAVVNAAGYVRVDQAELERESCWRENVQGPTVLADACHRRGIQLVTFSSDLVFDGSRSIPYLESDRPSPLGMYGRSKAEAERRVLVAFPRALVIRTSAFFGPWDRHNFVTRALEALGAGRVWPCATDEVVSPTYVPDLVQATLDILLDRESGIWHLANSGAMTWAELARTVARMSGSDEALVLPRPSARRGLSAPRPSYSALGSGRGELLPSVTDALARYLVERERVHWELEPAPTPA